MPARSAYLHPSRASACDGSPRGKAAHESRARPAATHHPAVIHYRENPAGFWVSRTGGKTVTALVLSCCEDWTGTAAT